MAPSELVSNLCKFVSIREAVAHPGHTQPYIQPTNDNEAHLVHFSTTVPNSDTGPEVAIIEIELPHPHTDACTFCAALRGRSPASVTPVSTPIIPRRYRLLVESLLFPVYMVVCMLMLHLGRRLTLAYHRRKATLDPNSAALTACEETERKIQFLSLVLLTILFNFYKYLWV